MSTPTPLPDLPADEEAGDDPGRRWWIWAVYVCLYAASIPWYLPSDNEPAIWLGLPYWVVASLAATVGIAWFTVLVVSRYWSDAPDTGAEDAP